MSCQGAAVRNVPQEKGVETLLGEVAKELPRLLDCALAGGEMDAKFLRFHRIN